MSALCSCLTAYSLTPSCANAALSSSSASSSGRGKPDGGIDYSKYRMLSPSPRTTPNIKLGTESGSADPTSETFASAQAERTQSHRSGDKASDVKSERRKSFNVIASTPASTLASHDGKEETTLAAATTPISDSAHPLEIDMTGITPGEIVLVAGSGENGEDTVATVFLMSGGGKGPAGKSKAKYKSKCVS